MTVTSRTARARQARLDAIRTEEVRQVRVLLAAVGLIEDAEQRDVAARILGRDVADLDELGHPDRHQVEDAVGGGLRNRRSTRLGADRAAVAAVAGGLAHHLDGSPTGRVAAGLVRRPRHGNGRPAAGTREQVWQVAVEDSPARDQTELVALQIDDDVSVRLATRDVAHLVAALAAACAEIDEHRYPEDERSGGFWRNVLDTLDRGRPGH